MSFHAPVGAAGGIADALGAGAADAPAGACAPPHDTTNDAAHHKASAIAASAGRFRFVIRSLMFMGHLRLLPASLEYVNVLPLICRKRGVELYPSCRSNGHVVSDQVVISPELGFRRAGGFFEEEGRERHEMARRRRD